jgi:hypothetical protein
MHRERNREEDNLHVQYVGQNTESAEGVSTLNDTSL